MKKQIQSYSTLIDKTYSVSMVYRQSSAIYNPCWYYEILVFRCDNGLIKNIIYEKDAWRNFDDALITYNRIVKLFTYIVKRKLR